MEQVPNFKCILVGDAHVGKSKFLSRCACECDDVQNQEYRNVLPIIFKTNTGFVKLELHDTLGQEKSGTLPDRFFWNADCAIILFDTNLISTFTNVFYWHRRIISLCGKIPIVLCGNGADTIGRRVSNGQVTKEWGKRLKYFEMCSTSDINEPFKHLTYKLLAYEPIAQNEPDIATDFSKVGTNYFLGIDSLHNLLDLARDKNSSTDCWKDKFNVERQ